MLVLLRFVVSGALALSAGQAFSQALPGPTWSLSVTPPDGESGLTQQNGSGAHVGGLSFSDPAFQTFSAADLSTIGNEVSVSGSGTTCFFCTGPGQASAGASIGYDFTVLGAASDTPVPVDITYRMALAVTSFGAAEGLIQINFPHAFPAGFQDVELANPSNPDIDFENTIEIVTGVGALNSLELAVSGNNGSTLGGFGTFSGSVDPYVQIDPTFALANPGYSIEVSSGIGNSPANGVPEPGTWALMIAGFGLTGAALRRRQAAARA